MSEVARLSEQAIDHRGRITQGYISRLESGKETNPSLMKLMTLCGSTRSSRTTSSLKAERKNHNAFLDVI